MKRLSPKGPVTKGVDVSHHNGHIDFKRVKAWGGEFVFAKASEGIGNHDPMFQENILAAKGAGMLVGAYHFYHPAQDPILQAKNFLDAVGRMGPMDLPLVLDFEVMDNRRATEMVEPSLHFLDTVEHATGKKPIIYASPGFLEPLPGVVKYLTKYPLWIANYGVKAPLMPSGYKDWQFWQNLGDVKNAIPGIQGKADGDLFNGTLQELMSFAGVPVWAV